MFFLTLIFILRARFPSIIPLFRQSSPPNEQKYFVFSITFYTRVINRCRNNEPFPLTVTLQSPALSSFSWGKSRPDIGFTVLSCLAPWLWDCWGCFLGGLGRFGHTPFPCTADTRPSVAAVMTPCFWRPTQRRRVHNSPGLCSRCTDRGRGFRLFCGNRVIWIS